MATEVCNAVVSGVASKVAEILFDPIQREICYVFKYKSYVEKLRSQLGDLNNKKQRLDQTVENAERQGEKIFVDVEQRLIKMNEFIARAAKLVGEKEDKVKNKRCFIGLCPNLMSRHKLSKEAVKAAKDAGYLLREGYFKLGTSVSYRPATERTEGYQHFDSRMEVSQNVMEALKDPNVNMIGLYGMGGVGKTTLAKQVVKKVMEDQLFDEVVMAEVTQNPNLKAIQDKFAYDLGLSFLLHESAFERVGRLCRRLKEKRVLVILDNIWAELKLEDVGIPFGDGEKEGKDVQRRCTVLLTSRSQRVLLNGMNSQKNFLVDVLSDKEAMILFRKTTDNHSTETSNFQLLANEIVSKCGGLPVVIKTIASALKNKSIEVWKDALNQLRNSDTRHIPGMEANVSSTIKLSYNCLDNEEAKFLFRLCALHSDGSQIPINDLMMYGMGSGSFQNVNSLEQVRDRVHTLIDYLKSSCLLLDGDNEHVKMHAIVHAVGVSIAAEEHMFNFQNVGDLEEEFENVIPKDPIAISLTCRDIQELPERLECPKLNLFLAYANYGSSLQVQNLFFEGMKELRVLNLTRIVFPPSLISLACLINLRSLSLIDCRSLVDVALVGELKKLQILSFRGSDIKQLPVKIGELTQLKKLDLSDCSRLEVIAPNVISKLSQLEELYLINSFTQWEKGEGGSNASLVELIALSQLTTLEINIPDVEIVPQDLVSVKLQRFKIFLGDVWNMINEHNKAETSRTLKFSGLIKNSHLGKGMKKLLKRTEELYLNEQNGFQIVGELDDSEGFPQLKHLYLQNSPKMLYLVNIDGQVRCHAFPLLQSLLLRNLTNLEKIFQGKLIEDQSFSKLRIVKVEECHELKHLFSFSMAKNLLQLQEIKVTNCKGLKLIVGEERENYIVCENESINFNQLHSLALTGLPQLRCSGFNLEISRRLLTTSSSASKGIVAEDDPQNFITVLFNNKVTFPILETLKLSSLNIKKIWLDQFSTCQNLTKLEVKDCSHLKFLFSYFMVHSLVQLRTLLIEGCKSMECVINTNGLRRDEEQMIEVLEFSKLNNLTLSNLPRLARFVSTSSSKENSILHTDTDMQSLFDEMVAFPSLEVLQIRSVNELRKIWHHQLDSDSFSELKLLEVTQCNKLMNIFSSNIILGRRFRRLEKVRVVRCKLIKDIIEEETNSGHMVDEEFPIASTSTNATKRLQVFPQLTSMQLESLPDLKSIYQGVHMFEWPMLKYLVIKCCDKVEILFGSSELVSRETMIQQPVFLIDDHKVVFPNLKTLEILDCNGLRNLTTLLAVKNLVKLVKMEIRYCQMIEEIIQNIGEVKEEYPIIFSGLVYLELDHLPILENFCVGIFTLEFPYLKQVAVSGCQSMKTFSRGILRTPHLQKVQLTNKYGEAKEERWEGNLNFTIQKIFEEMGGLRALNELILSEVPRVQEMWYDQTLPISIFGNLGRLVVDKCMLMPIAIPANVIRFLKNLGTLTIRNCDSVEEVFQLEEGNDEIHDRPLFPKLLNLELVDLPKLKRFCNFKGKMFPRLLSLSIESCPNMKTCICNSTQVDITANEEPQEKSSEENFATNDIQPLFDEKIEFSYLQWLRLSKLPELLYPWKEYSHPRNVFQNLYRLEISECSKLEQLVPSSVSFRNLWRLEVSKCNGLRNLVTISTAKSLRNLSEMKITDCEMVEEIIVLQDGEEVKENPIVFNKLKNLMFDCLPSLTSFYFGNYGLEFPSLEKVIVRECPKMKHFSQGVLSTPKLQRLLTEIKDKGRWEGNLNSTIKKLYEEMNVQSSKDED